MPEIAAIVLAAGAARAFAPRAAASRLVADFRASRSCAGPRGGAGLERAPGRRGDGAAAAAVGAALDGLALNVVDNPNFATGCLLR